MIAISSFDVQSGRSCFEFRMGIEGEAAAAAARKRTSADLVSLSGMMKQMEDLQYNGKPGLNEDFEFHMLVARASHNDYYVSVLQSLKATIFEGMLYARTACGLKTSEKISAINEQHQLVFEAIVHQDCEAAREAMRAHLLRCRISTNHWQLR
ncbi:FCD domain-containing protein [Devosia sp. 1635]|uniref:FadR/GntR family transcriptional regulator n=1 Tax=Devosia sp. 1635 TaxID=2726066 RepID=UPI001563632B|nr:FCD domain-containing protein [Devosia sp. 1635]